MVSIIVPVYKVEHCLPKCLDSILAQTYKEFEVILVNDGSPDNAPAICEAYAQKDDRVIVIHKENGGVSSARNAGLEIARGEYIGFVDSDDWLEPEFLERLIQKAEKTKADGAFCGYHVAFEDPVKAYDVVPNRVVGLVDQEMALNYIFHVIEKPCYGTALWNKLFKKSVIGDTKFPLGITVAEDAIFLAEVVLKCKSIYLLPEPLYYYYQREDSAMHTIGLTKQKIDDVYSFEQIANMVRRYRKVERVISSIVYTKGIYVLTQAYLGEQTDLVQKMKQVLRHRKYDYFSSDNRFLTRVKYIIVYYMICMRMPRAWVKKLEAFR